MSMPPHDDTSTGAVTQGGGPDAGAPGPARTRGRSIWWIAAVALVAAVIATFWLTRERPSAPAEAGATPVAGSTGGGPATPRAP